MSQDARLIKASDRFPQKKVDAERVACDTLRVEDLRVLLLDMRRRLNTIEEILDKACEMTK